MASNTKARSSFKLGPIPALLAVALVTPGYALAQQATDQPAAVEKITVTGSNLKRTDTETASPVQVLTREDIQRSGYTSTSDLLHSLTANGEGNLNQAFSGAFAAGASGIALRGLTVDATLVLIDGHRMAAYPISDDGQRSFVDVSNIPLAVVERIEILKDGASAIYGSDAIAGVVNIILRKEYTGAEVSGEFGISGHGDAIGEHVSGTYGISNAAGDQNTYINIEYRHQESLYQTDRPGLLTNFDFYHQYGASAPVAPGIIQPGSPFNITNTQNGQVIPLAAAIAGTGTPTNVTPCTSAPYPAIGGGPPLGGCTFNAAQYYQIQPDTHNINLLARHSMDLGNGWSASLTGSLFNSWSEQINAPQNTQTLWPITSSGGVINTSDPTAQPIVLPVGNVNNPLGVPAWLGYNFSNLVPHTVTNTSMFRLVGDISGTVSGWDVNASIGYIRGVSDQDYTGYVRYSGLQEVIARNLFFVVKESPGVEAILAPPSADVATSNLEYVEASASHEIVPLAGGPLELGIGTSVRHEGQYDPGQPGTIVGDVMGYGTTFIEGSDLVDSIYVELDAPVLKSVDLDFAVRYDHYPFTGDSTTPKFGATWAPFDSLKLRTTYAGGFRAPGPGERGNSGVSFFTTGPNDPLRCPTTHLPGDCGNGLIAGLVAGNPDLKPESSESWTVGFIWQPLQSSSLSVDWFKIRRSDEIIGGAGNPTYVRGPVQAAFPGLPGPIVSLIAPYANLNLDNITGFDLDWKNKFKIWDYGNLIVDGTWTHIIRQLVCVDQNCADVAGTHGPTGISGNTGTPKDRGVLTIAFLHGPWEIGTVFNYVSGVNNSDPTVGAPFCGTLNSWYQCNIAGFTDVDLEARYDLTKQLTLTAHIFNLTDKQPPFDPQTYGGHNYNPAFAQAGAIGRFFQVGASYKF